jgi:hypothetical protein
MDQARFRVASAMAPVPAIASPASASVSPAAPPPSDVPVPVLGSCAAPPATGVLVRAAAGVVVASDPPDDGVPVPSVSGVVVATLVLVPAAVGEPSCPEATLTLNSMSVTPDTTASAAAPTRIIRTVSSLLR